MLAGRSFLWFNPFWKVEMTGIENYVPGKPMILIANHQSFLDMPLLATLPWRMKWVSKDGLFKVPILGWFMSMSGHVSVKRGTTAALKALDELKPFIKAGIPVMLFPEGTRSRSGELLKFKSGAFLLSKDMNVPVQPVLISGTRNVMKPDTWKTASTGKMTLTLMKQYNPYDFDDVNSMRDVIYNDMAQELNAMTNR
jgi:1-acyl-sn-glycerol-3-phosphate acyltransferase